MYGRFLRSLRTSRGYLERKQRRRQMPDCTNPEYKGSVCPSPETCGRDGCQYARNQSQMREGHAAAYERAPGRLALPAVGTPPPPDPVTETIRQRFLQRQRIGFTRYGIGLGRADFTMDNWLQHLEEELMDALQYVVRLRMTIDGSLPIVGSREDVKVDMEHPNEEIARLTEEMARAQSCILQLVGFDPKKRYTLMEEVSKSPAAAALRESMKRD